MSKNLVARAMTESRPKHPSRAYTLMEYLDTIPIIRFFFTQPSFTMSIPPNTTLYVKNIPNKIKKEELKRQIYCLFSTYGKILDVVATKVNGMRGQAFVVFQDLASSTAALRGLDGFSFYDKTLVSISFVEVLSRKARHAY